jgi:uncharacterized protein (TIGR02301 family)
VRAAQKGLFLAAAWLAVAPCAAAEAPAAPPTPPAAPAPAEPAPPPYEPQLLRLSEIMGALAYLRDICGAHDADAFRAKMTALLSAEATTDVRKERLAGAYNHGFQGYALTYRACTPGAQTVIARFLDEAAKIAKDLAGRYGG